MNAKKGFKFKKNLKINYYNKTNQQNLINHLELLEFQIFLILTIALKI